MSKHLKNLFSALIVVSVSAIYVPETQAAGACAQKVIGKCQAGGREAGNTDASAGNNLFGNSTTGSTETGAAGRRMSEAAGACRDMKKQCAKCPPAERQECEKGLDGAAGQMDAQSASMGDASAMMGAIAGLAAAAMAMANQQKKEDEEEKNDSAFLGNGQYDCTKNDAYQFSACDNILAKSCRNAMEDPRCVAFSNRLCAAGAGAAGANVGFCNFAAAYGFCRPGGRDQCPSCMRLLNLGSADCQANPAACIPSNSATVTAATLPAACGQDPLVLADPQIAAALGGGAQFGQAPVNGAPPGGAGLAPPVLPGGGNAPVGGGGGNPPVVNPGGGGAPIVGGGGGGPPVPPPVGNGGGGGVGIAGAAQRDGGAPVGSANGVNASAGGGGVAAGTVISIASVGGGGGGGAIREGQGGGRAVANAGPAPDVSAQYGPSVFAVGTQTIRNKCAAGKFMHCP